MAFDPSHAFTDLLSQVDAVVNNFTFKGYQALVNAYARDIGLAVTLYIAMLGVSIINSWVEISISHATRHILKIILVYAVATQWALFSTFIYEVFTNTPNDIASKLVHALGGSYFGTSDPNAALQVSFNQSIDVGLKTWSLGNWNAWSPFLFAIGIWVFALLTTGLVLLELATAKFALAVLLTLAPVFIPLYLWDSTRGFFDGWLRWIISFALVPVFLASVLLLGLSLQQLTIAVVQSAISAKSNSISQIFPFLLSSFVTVGLIWKVPSMASGIAGGGFSSGASQGLGAAAGGLAAGALIGSKASRSTGKWGGAVGAARSMVGAAQRGINTVRNRFKQQRNKFE